MSLYKLNYCNVHVVLYHYVCSTNECSYKCIQRRTKHQPTWKAFGYMHVHKAVCVWVGWERNRAVLISRLPDEFSPNTLFESGFAPNTLIESGKFTLAVFLTRPTQMQTLLCIHICIYVHMHAYPYVYTHTQTHFPLHPWYTHTYIYKHTHAHTQNIPVSVLVDKIKSLKV